MIEKSYAALSGNQLDNCAVESNVIRCFDDGPLDGAGDNKSIISHHQVIGRRRCRLVTTNTREWSTCIIILYVHKQYNCQSTSSHYS